MTIEDRTLEVSNLAKVMYPATGFTKGATGFTKGEVIDYYVKVAAAILPQLARRPLTMVRWPNGVADKHFFEKRCPSHAPEWVATAEVPSGRFGIVNHVVCNDLPTLVWLANLASLELHTLLARSDRLDHPTHVMFDLDPGPKADILTAAQVALEIKAIVEGAGESLRIKTSGSKGLHLCMPVADASFTYDQTRPFAHALAQALEQRFPALVVSVQKKEARGGKVLVDWNQNGFTNTTVAAYSLRATPTPKVSTPITWEELDDALTAQDATRLSFGPADVIARLTAVGDLWSDVA